jgi:hypothetical protein
MMSRDHVTEMRKHVDAATAGIAYSAPLVAKDVVAWLRLHDSDLLNGWLHCQAEDFVAAMIRERDASVRAKARQTSGRKEFGEAAEAHRKGDSTQLVQWLQVPLTLPNGTRARLADLTAEQLLSIRDSYRRRAVANLMTAAFLDAVARRIGDRTVGESLSNEDLTELWRGATP